MHGVKKEALDRLPPEKIAARAKKTAQYRALSAAVMARRAARQYDEESLGLTGKLLENNPECYTAWNYRRELLGALLADKTEAETRALCERELCVPPPKAPASHGRGQSFTSAAAAAAATICPSSEDSNIAPR